MVDELVVLVAVKVVEVVDVDDTDDSGTGETRGARGGWGGCAAFVNVEWEGLALAPAPALPPPLEFSVAIVWDGGLCRNMNRLWLKHNKTQQT